MDKNTKNILFIISFGVIMFAAAMHLSAVLSFLKGFLSLMLPLIIGLVLAFILSVPMGGFEKLLRKLFKGMKKQPSYLFYNLLSFILTLLVLILVLVLVVTLLIPELVSSVKGIVLQVQQLWPRWMETLSRHDIDTEAISQFITGINIDAMIQSIFGSAGVLLDSVKEISSSIASGLINTALGLVVTVYVLLGRRQLKNQCMRAIYAYLPKERADRIVHIAALCHETFSKFLSGQCLEACILGSLIFIAFSFAGLPYAGLIAVLTGFCAFVPYVGSFTSCFIGVLLTLLSSPSQALLCVIVYLAVQFIENQFIYPNVVGNSVGLSPLFTLLAVMLGGKLFGLLGMIFFIPVVAVFYTLVREDIIRRSERKPIPKDSKFAP